LISGGFEEVGAFGLVEAVEHVSDARDEGIDGSLSTAVGFQASVAE